MNRRVKLFAFAGLIVMSGSMVVAQDAKETDHQAPANQPQMELPPGWTAEDMQACMLAGMPGEMHEFLAKGVGTWHGKNTMWMTPDAEPMHSECTSNVRTMMDGRYITCELTGEMPGMGVFNGYGIYAFDNVSQSFQSTWIDNFSTGIMSGKGELSSDRKTLTWNYTYNCPVTKKATTMREVERIVSEDRRTLTMFGTDPISGKEFKMMEISLTRVPTDDTASAADTGR